jgi:four helix bundle protein
MAQEPPTRRSSEVRHFEDLEVWQKARSFTKAVYRVTSSERFSRDFALRDQVRRAAVSVMANIAEGFERDGDREFRQLLTLGKGSAGEARAHLYVALDAGYLTPEEFQELQQTIRDVSRQIWGLMDHLKQSEMKGPKFR